TSVKNGVVTLSRPIDSRTDITGKIRLMRFGPFQKPFLADGVTPNPAFRATMDGWLSYIKNACSIAKSIYGSDQFDLEIWNELIYSYTFLDADNYYQTSPDVTATGNTRQEILKETGAFIKNPANGFTNVRITNGFANQSPYPSAQGNPDGITALSKHDYTPHQRIYPGDLEYTTLAPLDALLQRNTKNSSPPWIDSFVPSYVAHYPEEWQSALFTEAQTRDMSPITTYISGAAHGTNATNANGQKSQVWETEWGTEVLPDPQGLQPTTTGGGPKHKYTWDQPSLKYIQAKSDIRYLSSYVNKGLSVVDFFSATARGELRMVDSNFLNQIDSNPSVYPGDSAGGTIMQTLQRFTNAFSAAKPITAPINLSLNQLDDYTGNIQFKGNGSLQYPNLYNRDMFGFFPYQLTNTSFLIPVYVQTLDIEKIYNSGDTNVTKFDMPSETYRLTIGRLNSNAVNSVSLYDPLTQAKPGVNILSRSSNNLVIEVPVTDSPRLLYISLNPNFSPPTIKKPTVNITNPINGTSVSGKINVQANATSDLSTSVVSTQFFLNGKQLSHLIFPPSSCNINCPAFSYTWDTSTLLGGQYTLIAVVQDGLGNTVQSLPITVTVTNSIAKPTINIVTPYDKAIVSGKVIIQSTATTDPSTSVKNVQYFLDKLPLSSLLTNGPTYTYSWDTSITTATRHTLQALVFDNLGNKAYSKTFLIKVR
ncbi:MAG TPA: Ig-like domain-containing protein, partial [Patescibacteria group bacterium]|nr:Ig-like domain-containing protein [Patescibacteria group bacterium]